VKLEALGSKAAAILSILILLGTVVGFLDIRHAKAADVEILMSMMKSSEGQRYEQKIEEIEDTIGRLQAKSELSNWEKLHLTQLKNRKARYLRLLHEAAN